MKIHTRLFVRYYNLKSWLNYARVSQTFLRKTTLSKCYLSSSTPLMVHVESCAPRAQTGLRFTSLTLKHISRVVSISRSRSQINKGGIPYRTEYRSSNEARLSQLTTLSSLHSEKCVWGGGGARREHSSQGCHRTRVVRVYVSVPIYAAREAAAGPRPQSQGALEGALQTSMFSMVLVLSTRFMMPASTLPGPSS